MQNRWRRLKGNNCGDWFEHRKLLEDLTNKLFTKKLGNRKFPKKIGLGYFVGNTFLTIKIYNGFGLQKS